MGDEVEWYVLQSWSRLRATIIAFIAGGVVLVILGLFVSLRSIGDFALEVDGAIAIAGGLAMVAVAYVGGGFQTLRVGVTSKGLIIVRPYRQMELPASEVVIVRPRQGGELKEFFSLSFRPRKGSPWMKDMALPSTLFSSVRAAGVKYVDEPHD